MLALGEALDWLCSGEAGHLASFPRGPLSISFTVGGGDVTIHIISLDSREGGDIWTCPPKLSFSTQSGFFLSLGIIRVITAILHFTLAVRTKL